MRWMPSAGSRWFVGAALAALTFAGDVHAQSLDDRSKAATLFQEGHRLMAEGQFAAACPKLARSNALDPEIGTKMNLARCYELTGRTASAWWTWKAAAEAASTQKHIEQDEADQKKQADREAFARARTRTLEPHLLHVALKVVAGESTPASVSVDGGVVPPDEWGTEMPIDPGHHDVEARAPGHVAWSTDFDVPADQASCVTIVIPVLQVIPHDVHVTADAPPNDRAWMRPTAIAVASVSVVAALVGAGFGWGAIRAHERASNDCATAAACGDARNRDLDDLTNDATIADIAFVSAGAGLVVAGILWWTAPTSGARVAIQPLTGRGFNGVGLSGRF